MRFYAAHFSVYAAGRADVSFSDIASVAWARESILGLAARDVVREYGGGEFKPHGNVTRVEFVKMLVHAFDLPGPDAEPAGAPAFSDVSPGDWFYAEVAAAVNLGIVAGYPDGTFGGNRPITRQEMAVMAARAVKAAGLALPKVENPAVLRDFDQVAGYAKDAVLLLNQAGVLEGDASGMFRPGNFSTRAEAAKVLYKLWLLAE